MEGIVITYNDIIGIGALITAIGVMYKAFSGLMVEAKKPNKETEEKLEDHDRKLDNDNKRLKELETSQLIIIKSQLALVQHSIDGNGIEKLKEERDSIQEYLIGRK